MICHQTSRKYYKPYSQGEKAFDEQVSRSVQYSVLTFQINACVQHLLVLLFPL